MSRYPIIDSHIHLYPQSHVKELAWACKLPPDHVLNDQYSVAEYRQVTAKASTSLKGFVFLEADRISQAVPATGLSTSEPEEWKLALDEVSFLARVVSGNPITGEGHEPSDSKLVLGVVPWLPVTAGADYVAKYHDLVLQRFQPAHKSSLIKGYRYLFQDKPAGTMLEPPVLASLKWLAAQTNPKSELVFELGVDARSGGLHQLREACTLLSQLEASATSSPQQSTPPPPPLKIIINHLCKPNLRLDPATVHTSADFTEWKRCITLLSRYPSSYMKLSGALSELPPGSSSSSTTPTTETDIKELIGHLKPWTDVIFAVFGPRRTMFGSDWPVCNLGGLGKQSSWEVWRGMVETLLDDPRLVWGEEEREWVWWRTAREAYGIDI